MKIDKYSITKDTFVRLLPSRGYSKKQCSEAMQVMEVWNNCLTVKCKDGCMTKPYEHLEIISPNDYSRFKVFHIAPYFENGL